MYPKMVRSYICVQFANNLFLEQDGIDKRFGVREYPLNIVLWVIQHKFRLQLCRSIIDMLTVIWFRVGYMSFNLDLSKKKQVS